MNPFIQLISMLTGFYIFIILLRFFLQYFRADFYNPMSQLSIKATDPLIKPMRRVISSIGPIDVSTLLLAYLLTLFDLYLNLGSFNPIASFALVGLVALVQNILNLFIFLIFARILMSWIAPPGYHPIGAVIEQLTEPLIGPIRRALPPMAGFDFSPMILLLIIYFISNSLHYWIIPLL